MRKRRAQSLIEVTVGLVVVVPVLLVLFDLSVIFLAVQLNDKTCEDAARAAAAGDPKNAAMRAITVIDQANSHNGGHLLCDVRMAEQPAVNITNQPQWHVDDETGNKTTPGGTVSGTATVTTEIDVRPFVVQIFYCAKSPLSFRSQHECPLSYVQPPG